MVARLGPGSPAPASPAEVEALLRMVPVVAFFPELDPLVPAPLGALPFTPQSTAEAIDGALGDEWLGRVVAALRSLEARAEAQADGGLRFLAVALRHFLRDPGDGSGDEGSSSHAPRLAPAEHPLVVALFARTDAQRRTDAERRTEPHRPSLDHPNEVARVLDGW